MRIHNGQSSIVTISNEKIETEDSIYLQHGCTFITGYILGRL